MMYALPVLEKSWNNLLKDQMNEVYFKDLQKKLSIESQKHPVFPPLEKVYSAFELTPFHKVKVVIIGQDPYHNPNQAHGLAFSVPLNEKRPPSLLNIYKELHRDLGMAIPEHGDLQSWAKQGVLLMNASLTVRAFKANSHAKIGWQTFTDTLIHRLSSQKKHLVFMLWGNFAIQKKQFICEGQGHLILESSHPSPLSAYRGFLGSGVFSQCNSFLKGHGIEEIDWNSPNLEIMD